MPKKATTKRSFAWELLIIAVGAIILSSLVRAFVVQMFVIPSESMENTLLTGDRVAVQKLTDFKRGDIVVFLDPAEWLPESVAKPGPFDKALNFIGFPTASATSHLIKRVIGMPGDQIVCCDSKDRLTVNGQPLDESAYLYSDPIEGQVEPSEVVFDVVVPKDRIFVMGDHRNLSADSRCHLSDVYGDQGPGQSAFVPISDVVGPAFAIAIPFDRATTFSPPDTFADIPPPSKPAPAKAVISPKGVSC